MSESTMREMLLELHPDHELLFLDPAELDQAIVGLTWRDARPVLIYDRDRLVELARAGGIGDADDAEEWVAFNIEGAHMGERTPILLEWAGSMALTAAEPAEPGDEELQAVIACLGDDAAQLRDENPDDERADNMERAAELLERCVPGAWRCFHCDAAFTDEASAREHFGASQVLDPACTIDVAEYRRMEEAHARSRDEDTDLHREIHGLHSKHAAKLQREEEKGYARGLADAQAIVRELIAAADAWRQMHAVVRANNAEGKQARARLDAAWKAARDLAPEAT